jgi:hypothetical protein
VPVLLNPSMLSKSFGFDLGSVSNGSKASDKIGESPATETWGSSYGAPSSALSPAALQPAGDSWLPPSTAPATGGGLAGMDSTVDLDLERILSGSGSGESAIGGIWGGGAADPWQQPLGEQSQQSQQSQPQPPPPQQQQQQQQQGAASWGAAPPGMFDSALW